MRILLASAILLALGGAAFAGGFVERNLAISALAAVPGEDLAWGDPDWGERSPSPLDAYGREEREETPAARPWFAPRIHAGVMFPLLSKETEYGFGPGGGISLEIAVDAKNALWIRPAVDAGRVSAEEDAWEADSTLLLVHLDGGLDALRLDVFRASVFLSLGAGFEFFSGAETVGTKEDFSETNANALAGGGLALGLCPTPDFCVELTARLSFPLGSRNVQGLALVGLSLSYRFR